MVDRERLMKGGIHALNVLRIGQQLRHPGAWKDGQLIASLLAALLGVAWAVGFPLDVLPEETVAIAGVLVALVNAYLVVATTRKIGLPDRREVEGTPADRVDLDVNADVPLQVRDEDHVCD